MLRFFRQIRKRLLTDNKISRYLLYAVGEIFLVVIGILIALQVNNWKEDRLARQNEYLVVQDIYLELLENRAYLDKTLKEWLSRGAYIKVLADTLATEDLQLPQREFDSLLVGAITFRNFSPIRQKLDRVLSSDNLEFVESPDLIKEMMSLAGHYDNLDEFFQYNLATWKQIVQPYLITHYSYRNLNTLAYSNRDYKKDTRVNHEALLSSSVFDNIINNMDADVITFIRGLERSLDKTQQLQSLLESNYTKINALEAFD